MTMIQAFPLMRVLVATFVGICLGIPFRFRTGGIRTHVLVSIGATLFCLVGLRVAGRNNVDLLRVIQGVASGVGFVGAATVLKQQSTVSGVNVAASIWATAAIGCEVGLGDLWVALVIAFLVGVVSWISAILEHRARARHGGEPLP